MPQPHIQPQPQPPGLGFFPTNQPQGYQPNPQGYEPNPQGYHPIPPGPITTQPSAQGDPSKAFIL